MLLLQTDPLPREGNGKGCKDKSTSAFTPWWRTEIPLAWGSIPPFYFGGRGCATKVIKSSAREGLVESDPFIMIYQAENSFKWKNLKFIFVHSAFKFSLGLLSILFFFFFDVPLPPINHAPCVWKTKHRKEKILSESRQTVTKSISTWKHEVPRKRGILEGSRNFVVCQDSNKARPQTLRGQ